MNHAIWLVVRGIGSISGAGVFRIPHGHYEIGRIESSHIRVAHESVSRHHAMLVNDGGRVVVRDLGSRNGTFVDGKPIRFATLRLGSSLRIGGVTFDVVAHPAKLSSVGDSDETPAQFTHEPGEAEHRAAQLSTAQHKVLRLLLPG
jgi:pSer/pThr/pTyr-binding forkhead associated (FHA) protein